MAGGRLVVVGTGAEPDAAELSPVAVEQIRRADRVVYLTRWPEVARTVCQLRPDAASLDPVQAASPADGVLAVAEEALSHVRTGLTVAAVFVGPPARASAHVTAGLAVEQGIAVAMVPAVSAARWLAGLTPPHLGART